MQKNYLKYWLVCFVTLLLLAFNQQIVHADVDYSIDKVAVTANVEKNGSIKIHRTINYDFDDDAHGVYYRQNLNSNQKLLNQKVSIKSNGKKYNIVPGNGQNNTYQFTKDSQGYKFKVYHNINSDDKFSITYNYTITNAIINWRDTAELNFKIIGDGWDTDLEQTYVKVIFNNGQKVHNLKVWAHGPLSGYTKVNRQNGTAILTADDVAGDTGVEIHAIFPTSITLLNQNTRKQNHKEKVIAQEKQLAIEANNKRKRKKLVENIISWVIIILAAVASLFNIFIVLKKPKFGTKPRKYSELAHNYEIPDVDPVTAQILNDGDYPDSDAFTAYLTQLAGKNRIKIENIKHKNYRITANDPNVKNKSKFLKVLFDEVGNGDSFTTKQMRKADLEDDFENWQNFEFEKVEQANLINKQYQDQYKKGLHTSHLLTIFLIVLFIVSLLFIDSKAWLTVIIFLLGIMNFISGRLFKKKNSIYTVKGAEEVNKVRGFEKMLDDIGNFKMKDVGELIFWEDVMPYAVAFGLSKKVIKQLNIEFSKAEIEAVFPIYSYYWYSGNFESSFSSSLETGAGLNSSGSGSSGGFSGGSSGGFGGGSGGGAF